MAELMAKAATCNALISETCSANSDCEWNSGDSKCDLNETVAMQLMMSDSTGGPMAELMAKDATCNALISETCSANSDCEWKSEDNNCDLSGVVAMQLMMGGNTGGPMAELMAKGAACNTLTSETCSSNPDCEWNSEDNKCDLNGMVAMQLMMGDNTGGLMAELMA